MANNRIKLCWLLLLVLMYTASVLMSIGETQAHYENTVAGHTFVQSQPYGITSNCMVKKSDPALTVLVGELPMLKPTTVSFWLKSSGADAVGKLAWSVSDPEYVNYLQIEMQVGPVEIEPDMDIELLKDVSMDFSMILTPTPIARTTAHGMLKINVLVTWGDEMWATFQVILPEVKAEEEEPEETVDPEDPENIPDEGGNQTGGETGGETGDTSGNQTGSETGGETGDTSGGQTGGETGGETGDTSGGQTGNETGGETGDTSGGQTGNETGGETGDTSGGQTGGETGGETGDTSGGQTGSETGGETGDTSGDQTVGEAGEGTGDANNGDRIAVISDDQSGGTGGDETGNTSGDETGSTSGGEAGNTSGDETGSTSSGEAGNTSGNNTDDTSGDQTEDSSGDQTQDTIRMETLSRFDLSEKLPVKITVTEDISSVRLGLQTIQITEEEEEEISFEPFPDCTMFSLNNGANYYMMYDGYIAEFAFQDMTSLSVLLDFSQTELDTDEKLTLMMEAYTGETLVQTCQIVTTPDARESCRTLVHPLNAETQAVVFTVEETQTAAEEAEGYGWESRVLSKDNALEFRLPMEWLDADLEYSVEMLTMTEAQTLEYRPVTLSSTGLYGRYMDYDLTHNLVFRVGENLPQAGTYRLNMKWSYEGICYAQTQTTFFINYSAHTSYTLGS